MKLSKKRCCLLFVVGRSGAVKFFVWSNIHRGVKK